MDTERNDGSSGPGQAVEQDEAEAASPDHAAGSADDEQHDAPVGKEALTEADKDLPEDQTALQTDSS